MAELAYDCPRNVFNDWAENSEYLVVLAAKDEQELLQMSDKLHQEKITAYKFFEPDLDDELTAIAISPIDSERASRLLSCFPLALREERKLKE